MPKDRSFVDKGLNPLSKQDIYDTIPEAKSIFDTSKITSTPLKDLQKPLMKMLPKKDREQVRKMRRDQLIKNARKQSEIILAKRIRQIEENTK